MNKKIIIFVTLIVAILLIFILIFGRSSVLINSNEPGIEVFINNKKVAFEKNKKISVFPGNYHILATKEGYNDYNIDFKIGFFQKKEVIINMTEGIEKVKQEITEQIKNFIEARYTYENQTNQEYLQKIKPFLTEEYYDTIYYYATERKRDFIGDSPHTSKFISINFISIDNNQANVLVEYLSTTINDQTSINKKREIRLKKINKTWQVNYEKVIN